jgi:hypothetical protein
MTTWCPKRIEVGWSPDAERARRRGAGLPGGASLRSRAEAAWARLGPRYGAALAAALGVAAPVALLFGWIGAAFARDTQDAAGLAVIAAGVVGVPALAGVCTAATVYVASGRRTAAGAVGVAALGMIGAPTLLFAPTLVGMIFSAPAGLLAFVLTLPAVLLARRAVLRARAA